mgnify:CR=1 FL=1|tara:strand:- start:1756 stop:2058 length:303 start_codon:yes stop_codon:yes gene_type:complete
MANYKKMVDGKEVTLTDDEQAQRLAEEKDWADAAPARAWESLRAQRDALLASSDWTAVSDTALSDADKKKWADYRKLLRDLPSTLDDTKVQQEISWPSAP